jgi:5'-nucleotidase
VRVLVTNDDGITSPGLHALARLGIALDFEVMVAAPTRESSGASASLGAVEKDGQLVLEHVAVEGLEDATVIAVCAAPAFIVRAAIHGILGPEPDFILSGINQGQNTGHAVIHSGTVGAAITAATYGRPALAVSLGTGGDHWHWETAVHHARPVVEWLSTSTDPLVVNLNVPNIAHRHVRGRREAPLARFGVVQAKVTESGHGYVHLEYSEIDPIEEPASDAGLLAHGWATLTALRPFPATDDVDLSALTEWRELESRAQRTES